MLRIILSFLLCTLTGCSSEQTFTPWKEIQGRNGQLIYRARIPAHWDCILTPIDQLKDTMKPLCTFTSGGVSITIHNFPNDKIENRIPPKAQVARWKGQFQDLNSSNSFTMPESHAGFSGYYFEGVGLIGGEKKMVLAWAMQIATDHYHFLTYPSTKEEVNNFPQMRADYTIKAIGMVDAIEKNKDDIITFARSFELIQDIPSRS
jgi:hypothetical protein